MHASHKILNLNYKEYFGIRISNFVIPNIYIYIKSLSLYNS